MNGSSAPNGRHPLSSNPTLVLEPINDTFALKTLDLPEHSKVKIGRQTGVTTAPNPTNGYFDSKVLSRIHAEVWSEAGKVYIRDLKSSNGTFLNGRRLCPENMESEPFELNQNDSLEFGIDIMDENGALLHEKVSCKIYISRISYPTPASSPQDSHAKLKPISPAGSGLSPVLPTPVSLGGQSENIDLIISRLQNELTRSQETYADLGFLKHSLGELEKSMLFNGNENNAKKTDSAAANTLSPSPSIEYEKLLKQKDEEHSREISALTKKFKDSRLEWENQRAQDVAIHDLREENLTIRRKQEEANVALADAALQMNLFRARIASMAEEHQRDLASVQKEKEAALQQLEAKHREEINRLVLDADVEQEGLVSKHEHDLAEVLARIEAAKSGDTRALETELLSVKEEVKTLRQSEELLSRKIETLTTQLQQSPLQAPQDSAGGLEVLTGSKSSALAAGAAHQGLKSRNVAQSELLENNPGEGRDFSWSQFVFPMAKRNQPGQSQPSTMLLSGGFMLVGLGVYALWHKAGMTAS